MISEGGPNDRVVWANIFLHLQQNDVAAKFGQNFGRSVDAPKLAYDHLVQKLRRNIQAHLGGTRSNESQLQSNRREHLK